MGGFCQYSPLNIDKWLKIGLNRVMRTYKRVPWPQYPVLLPLALREPQRTPMWNGDEYPVDEYEQLFSHDPNAPTREEWERRKQRDARTTRILFWALLALAILSSLGHSLPT